MKIRFTLIFFIVANFAFAQDSLICSFKSDASYFTTDQYLNIYSINGNNEILKFNCITRDSIAYRNIQLGRPTYIDVTNPLKILVLYPDFSAIAVLDNKLAEITVIKFTSSESTIQYKPTAVCRETEGNAIWIYDELSRKLIRFDESGNKLGESEAFDDIFEQLPVVSQLISSEQKIYLFDRANGVFVFDDFGSFESNIELKTNYNAQIFQGNIVYIQNAKLYLLNLKTGNISELKLPGPDSVQVNMQVNYIVVRIADSLFVYSI